MRTQKFSKTWLLYDLKFDNKWNEIIPRERLAECSMEYNFWP